MEVGWKGGGTDCFLRIGHGGLGLLAARGVSFEAGEGGGG